jgi:hypothetical protein
MLRSNKLGVKTMNKTLTTHRQRNWKEYNNALKKRASLGIVAQMIIARGRWDVKV